jgi:hypothetical protein
MMSLIIIAEIMFRPLKVDFHNDQRTKKIIYDTIMSSVDENCGGIFIIYGYEVLEQKLCSIAQQKCLFP